MRSHQVQRRSPSVLPVMSIFDWIRQNTACSHLQFIGMTIDHKLTISVNHGHQSIVCLLFQIQFATNFPFINIENSVSRYVTIAEDPCLISRIDSSGALAGTVVTSTDCWICSFWSCLDRLSDHSHKPDKWYLNFVVFPKS